MLAEALAQRHSLGVHPEQTRAGKALRHVQRRRRAPAKQIPQPFRVGLPRADRSNAAMPGIRPADTEPARHVLGWPGDAHPT